MTSVRAGLAEAPDRVGSGGHDNDNVAIANRLSRINDHQITLDDVCIRQTRPRDSDCEGSLIELPGERQTAGRCDGTFRGSVGNAVKNRNGRSLGRKNAESRSLPRVMGEVALLDEHFEVTLGPAWASHSEMTRNVANRRGQASAPKSLAEIGEDLSLAIGQSRPLHERPTRRIRSSTTVQKTGVSARSLGRGQTVDNLEFFGPSRGRNLSTRVRQRSREFYEGSAAGAVASGSRRGVLAAA
jgi:hypothetical protein